MQFTFTATGSASARIASIDDNGVLTPAADISQGAGLTESTNVGDYWVVETPSGGCLAVFEIDSAGHVVVR